MKRSLHLLLCWLLLVALPLQGWAAASMALCASTHAGPGLASVPAHSAGEAHAPCHTHAQSDPHGHVHRAVDRPSAAEAGVDPTDPAATATLSSGAGGCAVCAWCAHAVSSLPATGSACPAVAAGRGFEPASRALPALSFLTPGLERPPR